MVNFSYKLCNIHLNKTINKISKYAILRSYILLLVDIKTSIIIVDYGQFERNNDSVIDAVNKSMYGFGITKWTNKTMNNEQ